MPAQKIQGWACHTVHDGPIEHWRVTRLLAEGTSKLCQTMLALSTEEYGALPAEVRAQLPALQMQLRLTDYFLSGYLEGESK